MVFVDLGSVARIVGGVLLFGLVCGLVWTAAGLWHFHVHPLY